MDEKQTFNDLWSACKLRGKETKKDLKFFVSPNAKAALILGSIGIDRVSEEIWEIKHKDSQPRKDQWLMSAEVFDNLIRGRDINRLFKDLQLYQTVSPNVYFRQYVTSDLQARNKKNCDGGQAANGQFSVVATFWFSLGTKFFHKLRGNVAGRGSR